MSGTANPGWSKAKHAVRDIHLDQDTAGRLLESMGDHARREMIVRTAQAARQNPAYRPIANDSTTSDETLSEVVCFTDSMLDRKNVNTLSNRTGWIFLVYLLIGCSSTRTSPPGAPTPTLPPPPVVGTPSASSWTFNYAPGVSRYQISRNATIESLSDSVNNREVSTNVTNELVTLMPTDSGVSFTAVADSFFTTTQGMIGPAQPVQLPVQVEGAFTDGKVNVKADTSTGKCNPVSSALVSDLHNLLTGFPSQLSQGQVWQDSVSASGCQAGIPTTSRTIRSYIVSGEAIYEGQPVLLVQRSDSILGRGEGAQQQHRLTLDATGTGNAIYYLDTKDGRIVRFTSEQELNLTITTSVGAREFKQSSRQDFRLAP